MTSPRLRPFWWCALAVALSYTPSNLHGQATIAGSLRQLTTHAAAQLDPAIAGDIVVYTDNRNGNDDVYFMNAVTGVETRVTTSTTPQRLNDVSGGRIVYTDLTPPAARIRLYDIATATDTAISAGPDQNPRIDGQIVVFERGSSSATDIVAVDLATNTETLVASTPALEVNPSVSGTKVVYERRPSSGAPGDIVLFDLATHAETLLASGANNRHPDIDGNTIVWDTVTADGSTDVVVYDAPTAQTRVLAMPANQRLPHVSGRVVSFDDDTEGNPDVAVYDLFSGAMKRIGGAAAEFLNDINGNRLVFTSNASGNSDIWAFEFHVAGDSLYGVSPNSGFFNDGLSVIAPATAATAFVGPLDPDPSVFAFATGLSARPTDRTLFAWNSWRLDSSGQVVFTGELLTVDACTGLGERVSPSTPPQGNLSSLVFAPDGSLFATSFQGLHRIDPATGTQTLVGSLGDGLRVKAINFVPDGTLYGAELTCGVAALGCPLPRLFTINTATGAATLVGTVSADVGRIDSIVFNPATGKFLGNGDNGTGGRLFDLNTADATVSDIRPLVSSPIAGYGVPSALGMAFAPSCLIGVAPTSLQFGAVEVGSSKSQIVTITNIGATSMSIGSVSLDPNGAAGFSVEPLSLPAALNPGASLDASLTFAPTVAGAAANVLRAATSAGVVTLAVRGTGVARPIPPSEQIAQVLQFFDDAVATGALAGSGQGNSSTGRVNALRNMLQAASDLIQQGAIAQACQQLLDVLNRTDGNPQPPDFVTGPAAGELAAKVRSLRGSLGCP